MVYSRLMPQNQRTLVNSGPRASTKSFILPALLLSLLSTAGCVALEPAKRDRHAEVRQAFDAWIAAYNRGQLAPLQNHYDSDIVLLPDGRPTFRGWPQIEEFFAPTFEKFKYELTTQIERIEISGNLAVVHGTIMANATPINGTVRHNTRLRYLTVLRRQSEGSWRVLTSMDNREIP